MCVYVCECTLSLSPLHHFVIVNSLDFLPIDFKETKKNIRKKKKTFKL